MMRCCIAVVFHGAIQRQRFVVVLRYTVYKRHNATANVVRTSSAAISRASRFDVATVALKRSPSTAARHIRPHPRPRDSYKPARSNNTKMASTTTEPTFTLDDVRRHNAAGDAWIVVDGAVYDVSKFAAMHPGGRHVLNQQAGKDASALFKLFHNDTVLRKYSRMLRKGKLADADADGAAGGGGASAMAAAMGFFGDVVPYGDPIWYTRFNSPYYKETHRRWRATVRAFCEEEIFPGLDKWQYSGKRPPADLMRKMGDAGLLAAMHGPPWPREYLDASARAAEPEDFDYFHELILYDEIARQGNAAVVAALTNGCAIALPAVMRFGSEEMRRRVAPDVLMGRELIALAISEPNAGSDVAGMALEARRDGDSYVLNGNKKWITNGMYSKYFVTAVVTGPKGGDPRRGLSLMLVDRDTPGFSTRKVNVPMADISGTAYLDFDDCRVPASALIGEQNKGFKLIMPVKILQRNFCRLKVQVSHSTAMG